MAELAFWFDGESCPELGKAVFRHGILTEGRISYRGKTSGAFQGGASFQWTHAVRALSILMLRTCAWAQDSSCVKIDRTQELPHLEGENGSAAASLDYALAKQPGWLLDMFGTDSRGNAIARRLLNRSNPERKRAGPVCLSLNDRFLSARDIRIFVGDQEVHDPDKLECLASTIEKQWCAKGSGRKVKIPYSQPQRSREADLWRDSARIPSMAGLSLAAKDAERTRQLLTRQLSALGAYQPLSSGRSVIEEFFETQLLAGPLPSPFDQPKWSRKLRDIVCHEVHRMLANTQIFDQRGSTAALQAVLENRHFKTLARGREKALRRLSEGLGGCERLGIGHQAWIDRHLRGDEPIRLTVASDQITSLAVLNYLKYIKGYNITLDYCYLHCLEVERKLRREDFAADGCRGCVVSLGPAASLLNRGEATGFKPLMLMPKSSRRVVAPPAAKGSHQTLAGGNYSYLDGPSGGAFYFNKLVDCGAIHRNKIGITHMEADEMAVFLAEGGPDSRALLWFPYYYFNQIFDDGVFVDHEQSELGYHETVLFISESLFKDAEKTRALEVAVRGAWLALMENRRVFNLVVDTIVEDRDYVRVLVRGAGLHCNSHRKPFLFQSASGIDQPQMLA